MTKKKVEAKKTKPVHPSRGASAAAAQAHKDQARSEPGAVHWGPHGPGPKTEAVGLDIVAEQLRAPEPFPGTLAALDAMRAAEVVPANALDDRSCGTCHHWDPSETPPTQVRDADGNRTERKQGLCRRFPPLPPRIFPLTLETDVCGEHSTAGANP